MRKRWFGVGMVILLVMGAVNAFGGEPDMNPGKWEITSTIEMPGMPMKLPPMTNTQCLTKDDFIVRKPTQPGMEKMLSPCKVTKSEVKGDTVIWDMVCEGQEKMTYHGEITYHGDTMEGFIKITSSKEGQPPMTMKMKGKRIGPCD